MAGRSRTVRRTFLLLILASIIVVGSASSVLALRSSRALTDLTYGQISDALTPMTSVQRTQAIPRDYLGKLVRWEGWVNNIKLVSVEHWMYVCISDPDSEIQVELPLTDQRLHNLNRGTPVVFQGAIQKIRFVRIENSTKEYMRVTLIGAEVEVARL
jgi:hypothetical protein